MKPRIAIIGAGADGNGPVACADLSGNECALTPMYQFRKDMLSHLRDLVLAPVSRLPGIGHVLTRLVTGTLVPPLAGEALPALPSSGIPSRKIS